MRVVKVTKDHLIRALLGKASIPRGLYDLARYFPMYGAITFKYHQENGMMVATSTNFRFGSIITHGRNSEELDRNIKDAILTSFEVPSSYAKEAEIKKVGEVSKPAYALP